MPVRIRLSRFGHVHRPFYRVRVSDSRAPRDGKFIEQLGTYDPVVDTNGCKIMRLNVARTRYWLGVGAQPSSTVSRLLSRFNLLPIPPQRSILPTHQLVNREALNSNINLSETQNDNDIHDNESQVINQIDRILDTSTPTESSSPTASASSSSWSSSQPSLVDIMGEQRPIAELPWQRRVRERREYEKRLHELQRIRLLEAEKQKEAREQERLMNEKELEELQERNKFGLRDTVLNMLHGKQTKASDPSQSPSEPQDQSPLVDTDTQNNTTTSSKPNDQGSRKP